LSFHGRPCPLLWSCRFWSLWNPLLQISHTNLLVANSDFDDKAITSASASEKNSNHKKENNNPEKPRISLLKKQKKTSKVKSFESL